MLLPIFLPEMAGQFKNDSRFSVVEGSTEGETILSTNNQKAPFNDLRVRRAIAHALNAQEIVDGAMFGYGTPIGTHFAPHHPACRSERALSHDPEKAKALLAEAGFPNGLKATLKLPRQPMPAEGVSDQAQMAKVGIELELIPVEWAQWLDRFSAIKIST